MKNKIIVTGGAGFIGSHIADKLLSNNYRVTVIDNLSSGRMEFLEQNTSNPDFEFRNVDLLEPGKLETAIEGAVAIFHLAANPDVRLGPDNTKVHLEQNIIATYNVLEAMRKTRVKNILFTSTSTVYGEATIIPTPEDYGPLVPISLYGASKLSCEALITSYCHTFNMKSWIFRFANIVGDRGTHGIIFDFIEKLRKTPESLEILGDGRQDKSYIHVSECLDAIMYAWEHSNDMVNIFNIGSNDTITATRIGEIIVEEMGLHNVKFNYTGGSRGWIGDVPKMMLSIQGLKNIGWEPGYNSEKSIRDAVRSALGKL
ncbi:MAG: NAD-dependent epimerase/dehydratase family protein [Candidatus Methanoperedens sp.]